ncbi:glycosyltransferase family 2 protein [Pseudomonas guariconensis]|uniref:glycosyltransferase family 2 protein n=1 Tax=Pseudomonas guariconensis TaxID=1288410 RepID=UPI0025A9CAF1|nr:glycosyltransferase family 2 protein [Pseudomonas guariconensis]MDM9593142.1 glycosyltransferase family 2 protein [Pseudomonas guariconensis]MDM9605969.1 glycosyltransferase family 2 protein [Pseudomonas guariconensis]MDM9610926.1 glycosyltransferase family 2 protein [Pseudomonas guariconensis]
MTNWALIAGGRCVGQPWRVGIAGFCVDDQQAFLLSDADWAELQRQLPLQPLAAYGAGNGLLFERVTEARAVDGILLVAHAGQAQGVFELSEHVQRYLLLRTAEQHEALLDETSFAKVFTPAQVPRFDERLVCVDSSLLTDPACEDPQRWAAVKEPDDRDYARLYHRSADFWIRQVTTAIADDAAAMRQVEPLMSVVIPTYNYGRYLAECIQSVLDQGVDDIEILVLDNASTDDTSKVMAAFAYNPKIRYIRNRYNYGPGYNWRNGLRIAQGRYFTFLSADDYFNPGHLSSLLPTLERQSHVAVGYTGIRWVNGAGQALNQRRHLGYRNGDYVGGRNEVADLLVYDSYMTPSAVIYRREAFQRVWRPGKSYGAGDWEMVVQMAERYPDFAYVDTPGVNYRWHGAQESNQFYASTEPLKGHLAIVEGVFEREAQHNLYGREREVAAHLKRRLDLYPHEQNSELGSRTRQLCERLEAQARQHRSTLFTVVLTSCERPLLIGDMLSSLAHQPFRDFEVILVNASGAPVESLVAEYDFPVTYIRQGRDRSLAAARNATLHLSAGRHVVYLDDEDLHRTIDLEALAKTLRAHPDSVIYKDAVFVQDTVDRYPCEEHSRERLLVGNYVPMNTFACPRALALAVGGFDESLAA